jgi:TonB family protein
VARRPTGAQVTPGSARAETGATSQSTGLAFGGGGTGGNLEVTDFCCPAYLQLMLTNIRANWRQTQVERGVTVVRYVILRDGRIAEIDVERRSGSVTLDNTSIEALRLTRLPPLPAEFDGERLVVHLNFKYGVQ